MKKLLNIFFCLFCSTLVSQNDPLSIHSNASIGSQFKSVYHLTIENDLITEFHNFKKRAKYKIKTIIREKDLGISFIDSLIKKDNVKNFIENHLSTKEYFKYSQKGYLMSMSIVPLYTKINAKDSSEHRFVSFNYDSLSKEYIIEYFYNKKSYRKEIYKDDLLVEINDKTPVNLGWTDKNDRKRDTSHVCDEFIRFKYNDKKQLISREYNNTGYYNPERLCDIIEFETYEYAKKIIYILKIPYRSEKNDAEKYINEIKVNANNQIVKSVFYHTDLNDPLIIYSFKYDKKGNPQAIYESYDIKKPIDKTGLIFKYENFYSAKGNLEKIVETCTGHNMTYKQKIYYYNDMGLLTKITYVGQDGVGLNLTERFYYTFY